MNVTWDYSQLARGYVKRPDYAVDAIDALVDRTAGTAAVCDIGAGTGHLTRLLAGRYVVVDAIEPNAAMRAAGIAATAASSNVRWFDGTGERTGRPAARYGLATFGSSFNVVDRTRALAECRRVLVPGGWFACLWNHRVLEDPLQRAIERAIHQRLPDYTYGLRREDQSAFLRDSGEFDAIEAMAFGFVAEQQVDDVVEAWRSHATLQRQAGASFEAIVDDIARELRRAGTPTVQVPYSTRMWVGRMKP